MVATDGAEAGCRVGGGRETYGRWSMWDIGFDMSVRFYARLALHLFGGREADERDDGIPA